MLFRWNFFFFFPDQKCSIIFYLFCCLSDFHSSILFHVLCHFICFKLNFGKSNMHTIGCGSVNVARKNEYVFKVWRKKKSSQATKEEANATKYGCKELKLWFNNKLWLRVSGGEKSKGKEEANAHPTYVNHTELMCLMRVFFTSEYTSHRCADGINIYTPSSHFFLLLFSISRSQQLFVMRVWIAWVQHRLW